MNRDVISALGEVFGAIAVVVSVCYLAIQVRKQTEESKLAATRELAGQFQRGLDMIAEDGELAAIWAAGVQDYMALPSNDRIRIALYMQRMTRVIEAQYLHTLNHNVNPTYYESTRLSFFEGLTFPGMQKWWELSRDLFEPGFRAHVDEMVIQAKEKGYNSSFKEQSKIPPGKAIESDA